MNHNLMQTKIGCWNKSRLMSALAAALLLAGALAAPNAFAGGKSAGAPGKWLGNSVTADESGSEVASTWLDLLYDLIKAEKLSPPIASRIYGIAGVTLYESVVPGMPDHRSLAGQLNGLATLPQTELKKKYHWPTAANSAIAAIARNLLPAASETSLDAIDALEQHFARQFQGQASVPRPVYDRSVAWGRNVAAAVAAWASGDGYSILNNCSFTPPAGPGLWVPTPPALAPPLQPCWGQLRPFVLTSGAECAPDPPPAYSEDPSSQFYALGKEVYDTGKNLTPEQITIARYWADGPG
ncbi:MAG: hypothetical protein DMF49_05535, partial [Acidobacteria bacterium]